MYKVCHTVCLGCQVCLTASGPLPPITCASAGRLSFDVHQKKTQKKHGPSWSPGHTALPNLATGGRTDLPGTTVKQVKMVSFFLRFGTTSPRGCAASIRAGMQHSLMCVPGSKGVEVIRATTRERHPGACRSKTPKFAFCKRHSAFDSAPMRWTTQPKGG